MARKLTHEPADALCLDEEATVAVSLGGVVDFLGGQFDSINVAANGYVSFSDAALDYTVSTPTPHSHFAQSKGLSFSLMLTDLDPPNAYVAHLDEVLDDNTSVPFAAVVTYLNPYVANEPDERRKTPAGCTVQAIFEYESGAVTVTFGDGPNWECDNLEAIIGPSAGNATDAAIDTTIVARLSSLLDGSLAPSDVDTVHRQRCGSAVADDEEADPYDDPKYWDSGEEVEA